ncbi:MAG TPA: GspE/PulE family protein [Candidatus Paceibacterota bacterium]|nr:GspE/PulE family protein [Candidatus Paceibacterota bacterium]
MTVTFDEDKQGKRLDEFKRREEEDVAQIVAARYGLEYADLAPVPINMDALRLVPEHDARDGKVAAFSLIGKRVKLAVVSPVFERTKDAVNALTQKGYEVTQVVASPLSLEKAWSRYADLSFSTETKAGALDISSEDIKTFIGQIKTIEDVRAQITEILKLKKGFRISKILEIVLSGALATKASDVHIEPEEAYVRLRYRLDGVLTDILSFDTETFGLLLSRIKLLSGLKLNIKSEAQDGRFSVKIAMGDESDEIEIRTSVLPGAYNESVVLRLLNPKSIQVPLEELGIHPKLLHILLKEIEKPNGMVLTTGPTGSGKTTTLYAFMRKIHTPQVKIITIEDPIEYHLPGIVQTQVNNEKNYSFALGLRSALRQDPDVIMVGEIRDSETAQTAINSALTGHLVFSTLHTNDAAGSFPRLIDLGVNPRVISSAVSVALAQRLVRKLCPRCKKEEVIANEDKKSIDTVIAGITDRALAPASVERYWKPVGCAECNNTGYRGRVGIYEGILITEDINKAIEYSTSESEIAKAAKPQGILTMLEDGVLKVLSGVTSLEELERVISIED